MSFNNKHLATLLLGAAAAFGAYKYLNLTDEEKEKLARDLKDRANKLKNQALDAEEKAADYFNELTAKGSEALKEYLPKVDEFVQNVFKGGAKTSTTATSGNGNPSTPGA